MIRAVGAALLVVGIVLVFFGLDAKDSFSSEVTNFFEGTPSDKAMWLLTSGALLAVVGIVILVTRIGRRAVL